MSSLLIKAINYDYPEELPVSVGFLPATWFKKGEELVKIIKEYPMFFPTIPDISDKKNIYLPDSYRYGEFFDEWGCKWSNVDEGMEAIVTGHPVPNREDILSLKIPDDRTGKIPHGFMYLRLLDLRGFEEAMIDFAEEPEELQILINKVLEYNLIQIDVVLKNAGEIIYFGDDLGMQNGLAIGANAWRKYLKPCFKAMFKLVKDAGKYVYMHTDGMIYEIMPDLQECGADIINPQFRANGLDNLVRVCKGKIPINLDLDRQLFPFATPKEIDEHIRQCVEALYLPEGGLGLVAEMNYEIPNENIVAVLEGLRKYRTYKG